MYICKRDGQGGYRVFETAMHERVLERLELRAELQRAIDEDQFELHYQPVMRLSTRARDRAWRRSSAGATRRAAFVQPGQFIPLAEEMGLIVDLGRWVLREACRQHGRLHASRRDRPGLHPGREPVRQAAPAPGRRRGRPGGARGQRHEAAARSCSRSPRPVMMADYELATVRLQAAQGPRRAHRDGRLRDGLLVARLSQPAAGRHPQDGSIVPRRARHARGAGPHRGDHLARPDPRRAGRGRGHRARGQYEALRELGCDFGQGFFIARPMDLAATRAWLADAERTWQRDVAAARATGPRSDAARRAGSARDRTVDRMARQAAGSGAGSGSPGGRGGRTWLEPPPAW